MDTCQPMKMTWLKDEMQKGCGMRMIVLALEENTGKSFFYCNK